MSSCNATCDAGQMTPASSNQPGMNICICALSDFHDEEPVMSKSILCVMVKQHARNPARLCFQQSAAYNSMDLNM